MSKEIAHDVDTIKETIRTTAHLELLTQQLSESLEKLEKPEQEEISL